MTGVQGQERKPGEQKMSDRKKRIGVWGWLLFVLVAGGVFGLGMLAASITERRAEVQTIYANIKTNVAPQESRNELYAVNYPRQYNSWRETADTSFKSKYNGSQAVDVLSQRPAMVILWAGYAFSREYNTPRGHMHAIEDLRAILRTGAPGVNGQGDLQPGTCWTCKGPDVPRVIKRDGDSAFYSSKWSSYGCEMVNPIGCADCHDTENHMALRISRIALAQAFTRRGENVTAATPQEMRSLVCAQCHVEYFFKGDGKYLTFPWDRGLTMEDAEAYYDSLNYCDYVHPLSKARILKAQHPDYELSLQGIHAQRGVSCADCHMPYKSEGGVKFSDHHVTSPLAYIDRTCQTCHRESEAQLRQDVETRQRMAIGVRNDLERELSKAHLEAEFAWKHGATEAEMASALKLIREAQWRWDYGVASHGASFHAPQEVMRILSDGLGRALAARLAVAHVVARHGHVGEIPLPDVSTKEKAQRYIGLDPVQLKQDKREFLDKIVPGWLEAARGKGLVGGA